MLSLCIEVHIPIQKVGIVDEGGILQVVQIEGSRHDLFVPCQAEGFYFVSTERLVHVACYAGTINL